MFKITTPVETEPVTLAEARLQCRIDSDDTSHDAILAAYITAAREYAEHYTGRALAPQTLEQALACFPADGEVITLDMPPVTTVTSIKYTDTAGAEQTLAGSNYALATRSQTPRNVALTYGNTWPATRDEPEAVRVVFVTGYDAVPKAVKSALLLDVQLRFDKLTPAEAVGYANARDSLLNTVKVWGF